MSFQRAGYFSRKQGSILKFVLGFVFVLFIAILVAVYVLAKRANPVMLDEKGRPVGSSTAS